MIDKATDEVVYLSGNIKEVLGINKNIDKKNNTKIVNEILNIPILSTELKKDTLDLSSSEFDNIEYISDGAFQSSYQIKELILPKNLTYISRYAIIHGSENWNYSNKIEEVS